MTWLEGWTTVGRVPIDSLTFSGDGPRRLCFFFCVSDARDRDRIRCHDEVELEFQPGAPLDVDAIEGLADAMARDARQLEDEIRSARTAAGDTSPVPS